MPLNTNRIEYLSAFYGSNLLDIQLTPIFTKIFREVWFSCRHLYSYRSLGSNALLRVSSVQYSSMDVDRILYVRFGHSCLLSYFNIFVCLFLQKGNFRIT